MRGKRGKVMQKREKDEIGPREKSSGNIPPPPQSNKVRA